MGKEGQLEWGQRNQKARSDYLIKILISIYDLIMEISLRYICFKFRLNSSTVISKKEVESAVIYS